MAEIIEASNSERIFYLPDFIYFIQTAPLHHSGAIDIFVGRILELLILFDRILIPAEHLNINTIQDQIHFKKSFLRHRSVQELIERKRIITTIWSVCSDIQEHLEATERYSRTVAANSYTSSDITSELEKIEVFKRNQARQSRSAFEFAKQNGWIYTDSTEMLRYADGKIDIPFSHENLLIGKGREIFKDQQSIWAAKLAYINAMPSGNGGIYRSLVPQIELISGETTTAGEDRLPPAFFTKENHRALLAATGLNVPFDLSAMLHKNWLPKFLEIAAAADYKKYQDVIFKSLEELAKTATITSDKDAKERMKLIQFVRPLDIGQIIARHINPFTLTMTILREFTRKFTGSYRENMEWLPARPVRRLNHLAETLQSTRRHIH